MKPYNYLTTLTIISILFLPLAACTNLADTATQSSGELPLASQLALGILKLDETTYPIDNTQAGELLPLWKALRALSTSDTTAPQEIEALVEQIQDTLTSDQLSAITAMNLTNEDIIASMQARGAMQGAAQGTPDSSAQATRQARIASGIQRGAGGGPGSGGGPMGGGMPPGGEMGGMPIEGGMPGMSEGTPNPIQTNSSGINLFLLNLVIQLLETK